MFLLEKKEQKKLRDNYIKSVRRNLRGQLENVSIVEEDGSLTKVTKKDSKKGKE